MHSDFFIARYLPTLDSHKTLSRANIYALSSYGHGKSPGGGTRIIFWRGVRPEVWNPYPYLRIFLPQKTADLKLFFEIFANRDPFLRVFLPQNGWFYHFFAIFAKWDPLLRIFLTKMGPMSKDFCWKSNPFGRHIPVCLNMWVPPPPPGAKDWCPQTSRDESECTIDHRSILISEYLYYLLNEVSPFMTILSFGVAVNRLLWNSCKLQLICPSEFCHSLLFPSTLQKRVSPGVSFSRFPLSRL